MYGDGGLLALYDTGELYARALLRQLIINVCAKQHLQIQGAVKKAS